MPSVFTADNIYRYLHTTVLYISLCVYIYNLYIHHKSSIVNCGMRMHEMNLHDFMIIQPPEAIYF